jgi:hypothetical protein
VKPHQQAFRFVMTRKFGKFASQYHRVGDQHLAIDSIVAEIVTAQKQFLFQFRMMLC